MSTFSERKLFTDEEVKAIRKSFAECEFFEHLELKMCVDGTPFKVDRGLVHFFRFTSSTGYSVELCPANVRHRTNEPATRVVIRKQGKGEIADYHVACSVMEPEQVMQTAFGAIEYLAALREGQLQS